MQSLTKITHARAFQTGILINELLDERHQVWSLYCKVAELKPFVSVEPIKARLGEFSQLLIDYVSLGHFGMYQHILEQEEHNIELQGQAERLYPLFVKTTQVAVLFNDKYDSNDVSLNLENLEQDLSILGESLARRIEMEDQLCSLMLS